MAVVSPAVIGVTTLAIAQTVGNVAAFGPSILDVQTYDNTYAGGDVKKSVRLALAMGGGLGVAMGAGGSLATGSWWPLIGAVAGLVLIWAAYEWAIRHQSEA